MQSFTIMKNKINIIIALLFLLSAAGCMEEEAFEFPEAAAPSNVDVLLDIAGDNSGIVTVYPSAQGATNFKLYFGAEPDEEPTEVAPGKSAKYQYPEGTYNLRVEAVNASGVATIAEQSVEVQFAPPENLQVDISITDRTVEVTPTADGATFFEVYFGLGEDEEATPVMPDESASHVYAATGTYTVRVIAKGAGAATAEFSEELTIFDEYFLPLTFENTDIAYNLVAFGGATAEVIDNPDASGDNSTSRVFKLTRTAGAETWSGATIDLAEPVDFTSFQRVKLKVWSPKAGINFLLKVENLNDPNVFAEVTVATTKANEWETLLFDFSSVDPSLSLQRMAFFPNFGNVGDGSEYYIDEVELTNEGGEQLILPVDFESENLAYNFTNFGGATAERIANPDQSGANTSGFVAKLNKGSGAEVWAGATLELEDVIDFSEGTTFRLKTWSPLVGAVVKLKIENASDPNISFEADATTSVASQWEELTYDFSGVDQSQQYQKVVVFFDFGNPGDASDYYFDDISLGQNVVPEQLVLPLGFESENLAYSFSNFGGATAERITNPDQVDANPSGFVAKLNKGDGAEVWAGATLELEEAIEFSAGTTFRLKTWSPKVGAMVKLKIENASDPNISFEVDATTTVASQWEELTYDFSGVDQSQEYQKVVIFFDFGNPGDNADYYFDDISLGN